NAKLIVERQECLQQILFVQCQPSFDQPLSRVVLRKKDVVHVHPHAGRDARQDLEKLVTDITAELHRMTRIDKQDVVCLKRREEVDINLFNALLNQLDAQ